MSFIEVRVFPRLDPVRANGVLLDHTRNRAWTDVLSDVGGGSFDISLSHRKVVADPSILEYGSIVKFALDGVNVFSFVIEKKTPKLVTDAEDAGRWVTVQGRGVLALLEDAVVYPVGGTGGDPERVWMSAPAGEIMGVLFDEARARGALATVGRDFTDDLDSDGLPYDVEFENSDRAGDDLLSVALRHADLAVDVRMTADLELQYFNNLGADRTVNPNRLAFRAAKQVTGLEVDGEGKIKNTLLLEGAGGFLDRQDLGSVTTYGRREGFVSLGNAKSGAEVVRAGDRLLQVQAKAAESVKVDMVWADGFRPYVDFDLGDWVLAPDAHTADVRQRVRSITVKEDDQGRLTVTPELNSRLKEFESRTNRWLKTIAAGALGGRVATAASPTSSPGTDNAIASAVAAHEATHPHPDELGDLVDVDLTGTSDEDVLGFDAPDNKWEPKAPGGLRGSAAWNPPVVTDEHYVSTDVACPGARRGDPAAAGFTQITAGWSVIATVVADDQVHVELLNRTGATVDLPSGTVHVAVFPS